MVVISKSGKIGEIVSIKSSPSRPDKLYIALPLMEDCIYRSKYAEEQYWERIELPKELAKIKSRHEWNTKSDSFKEKYIDYIEEEFNRREYGLFFMNNGVATYLPCSHYMYLQWSPIDVGYPEFREPNRIQYIYWEACIADYRCYGMDYVKLRRSGYSYMEASEANNRGTLLRNGRIGILSKTGTDAKKMFTDKVVRMFKRYPFFFKPIQSGMSDPKTELLFAVPATKITKKSMNAIEEDEGEGLNTSIDWRNTENLSYDSEKLNLLLQDDAGKWQKPNSITKNWDVTKTCLRVGARIIGKCMMGSTVNAKKEGGEEYFEIYKQSNIAVRDDNEETTSGLYSLFIPMELNLEGFIDRYGFPVLRTPENPILGIDGKMITKGSIDWWNNRVKALKNEPDRLNEFYRQNPRTESHAFRDESKESLFNLTKLYQQIDFNDSIIIDNYITQGSFFWKDGIKDTEVLWRPDKNGRFFISWFPPKEMQNRWIMRNGKKYPANEHIGAFGCDPYDISGVVGGGGSKGALHGLTKYHMDDAPTNQFFLEYVARPQMAEVFFEDVLMAIVFYGMPIFAENNKPRLLYHLKNRGYRGYSINRVDKHLNQLSPTELELGGTPNSSQDFIQAHASAIESYIEKYVGLDDGSFRPQDEMGTMFFNRTLSQWAKFDISARTVYDACISSGLAIMACQKSMYLPENKTNKISINFAQYNNEGVVSQLIYGNND